MKDMNDKRHDMKNIYTSIRLCSHNIIYWFSKYAFEYLFIYIFYNLVLLSEILIYTYDIFILVILNRHGFWGRAGVWRAGRIRNNPLNRIILSIQLNNRNAGAQRCAERRSWSIMRRGNTHWRRMEDMNDRRHDINDNQSTWPIILYTIYYIIYYIQYYLLSCILYIM